MRPRLALLDASHGDGDTRQNFRRELAADLVEFDASAGQLPADFGFDGVVVTGSSSSVYWEDDWISALVDWVAEAEERGLPILGVCFGHQVLASALGGRVADMGEYELGYREVRHRGDDTLFRDVPAEFTVFTTHSDAVVELPPDAELLAENEYGTHAFRHGHSFGVQFHPEYDRETAERITRDKDLPDERIEAVLAGITDENYAAACEAKRLFDNFVAYVENVGSETTNTRAADD